MSLFSRIRGLAVLGAIALLAAAPVAAQEDAPPSPEKLAAAKAGVDAIIAKSNVGDLFENVSADGLWKARHKASGLTCIFNPYLESSIEVFPSGLPRGDDVGCDEPTAPLPGMRASVTFYATRSTLSMDQEMAAALQAMKLRFGKLKPAKMPPSILEKASPERLKLAGESQTRWFVIEDQGERLITRVSVASVNGWTIKLRATAPVAGDGGLQLFTDLLWAGQLLDLRNPTSAAPAA